MLKSTKASNDEVTSEVIVEIGNHDELMAEIDQAERARQEALDNGLPSLELLKQVALGDNGHGQVVRRLLLSLYDDQVAQVNLSALRVLPVELQPHVLNLLALDWRGKPVRQLINESPDYLGLLWYREYGTMPADRGMPSR